MFYVYNFTTEAELAFNSRYQMSVAAEVKILKGLNSASHKFDAECIVRSRIRASRIIEQLEEAV
jgi:hypothetical protein